jgi:cell division protein FtsW (lipid II flippase)
MKYNLLREFKNYYREIDKALFFSVVAMLGFSIINIYGIDGAQSPFFLRQIIYSIGGIGVMIAVSLID